MGPAVASIRSGAIPFSTQSTTALNASYSRRLSDQKRRGKSAKHPSGHVLTAGREALLPKPIKEGLEPVIDRQSLLGSSKTVLTLGINVHFG
jgi:hypothetical protein